MQQVVKRGGKALLVAPAATAGKCCAGMHTRHISQLVVWESNKGNWQYFTAAAYAGSPVMFCTSHVRLDR